MTPCTVRWLGVGLLASACAGFLDAASMLNPASAVADDTALILGHAFLPTPDPAYIAQVFDTYIDPTPPFFSGQPVFSGYSPVGVTTPETDYQSGLTQGVADLNQAISQQLTDGNNVVVFSYSMSTSIATQEMVNLDALPADQQPNPADLSFVILEDLNNPNGGTFTRFPATSDPSLPATPADTPYPTDIYTVEYSGVTDFPQYDGDLYADVNAAEGYLFLHPFLLPDYPTTFVPQALAGTVLENTSSADVATEYFMIPTQDLPALELTRVLSPAMADLVQPDMRVLVDLGYDRTGDADVNTAATSSAPPIDVTAADANIAAGADQGIIAALVDLGMLPQSDLPDLYPYLPDVSGLESGSVTSDAVATADASASLSALTSDLTASGLTDLSPYLTALATALTDMYTSALGSI